MKKFLLLVVIFFSWASISPASVDAAPAPWVSVGFCTEAQATPNEVATQFVGGNSSGATSLLEILIQKEVCGVGIIGKEIWADNEAGSNPLIYCDPGWGFPQSITPLPMYRQSCCPKSLPTYINPPIGTIRCCPLGSKRVDMFAGQQACYDSRVGGGPMRDANGNPVSPVNAKDPIGINPPDGTQFVAGVDRYTCPATGCVLQGNVLMDPANLPGELTDAEIAAGGYGCLAPGELIPGDPDGRICLRQVADDPVLATLLASSSDINSCLELDEAEQERCLDCLGKNLDAREAGDPESFVYSSIGCVDTRQDQFITRLFQIGLGTISGIAVIQIMWGMIERQSTDPAKIQQGRDRAIAALTALGTVVGSIPILRFLGINVIQLLPINFLG